MNQFFTYAIYNPERDKIYIGHTSKLNERLKRHNQLLPNKTKSYTSKNPGEWQLVHREVFSSREEARRREKELKTHRGRKFIRKIIREIKNK